jgi:hypothetical protein
VEEGGFEPTVPLANESVSTEVPPTQKGAVWRASCILRGTEGSNPFLQRGVRCEPDFGTIKARMGGVAALEEIANHPARARGDNDCVRVRQSLQAGGEVRGFTDNRLLLRRSFAYQIADDDQPGGDPDSRLELAP